MHRHTLGNTRILTDAGVKGGVRSEDVASGEVDSVAGEAEVAAERRFWMQLRNGFSLSRRAASCKNQTTLASMRPLPIQTLTN